jgi:1-phosphatidylinositol-3-phosphate 5-kinase
MKWDPHGGKSRSEFCRMADNRFILKQVCVGGVMEKVVTCLLQLSRAEASSVVEFIPHYIANVKEALRTRKPSVLTRVVGVFRIGFRNQQTGRAWKQDVLVMENLFFGRSIARIFDLKGSMRSRYVTKRTCCWTKISSNTCATRPFSSATIPKPCWRRRWSATRRS